MPNVPLTLPDGAANVDVLIDFTTVGSGTNPHNAADYVGGVFPAGRITIPAGQTSGTVPYAFNPDNTVEPDETSTMSFSSPTAGVVISPGSVTLTGLNDDSAGGGSGTVVYGPSLTMNTGVVQTNSKAHKVETVWSSTRLITLRVSHNGTGDYVEMRQANDTSVLFSRWIGGAMQGSEYPFEGALKPAEGAPVSLTCRLASGSTTDYEIVGTYGTVNVVWQGGGDAANAGFTQAQGLISFAGDNTGRNFTITAL